MHDIEKAKNQLIDLKIWLDDNKEHEGESIEAIDDALMALEKQIPKKPKIINYGTNVCSNSDCQCDLLRWYTHCPDCGQCLNWEVEND